jgi:hypothetical protein
MATFFYHFAIFDVLIIGAIVMLIALSYYGREV